MSNEYKVTAARIARTNDDEISPREEVIERVQKQILEVYEPLFEKITEELTKVIPENDWYWKEYDEVKSVTKNPNTYKSIALQGDFYQVKYEITRYRVDRIMDDIPVTKIIEALTNAFGRKSDSSSKKPYQFGSVAYRNLWYFKGNNTAVVTRVNFRDYDGNETITYRTFLEISWFIYYNILESDLKTFLGTIPLSDQVIEQAFNVAGRGYGDNAFALNLPIQTISLNTKKVPKKFREYNQLFKLPDASIISLKFTDLRKEIEDFVEKATGIRECPTQLPRWFAPPEGVIYTSDGNTPDYISGEFPYAKGKLKDNDVSKYTFRICTKKDAENKPGSAYELPVPNEDRTVFVIREEPKATVWEDYTNRIFWTDFENSFVFYYNRDGYLQKVNIQGYQEISDNDIVRLFYSGLTDTQIDLSVAIIEGGREEKWFINFPDDAQKFKTMCVDLVNNVKDYTLLTGEDLLELESSARNYYVVNSAVVSNYAKAHPEFKDLFVKFFNQVGAIDATTKRNDNFGNRDAVALAKLMELGVSYESAKENIKKLEQEHLEIARDPKGNTPLLPKNIKNFTTKWPLFAQQAIAVSMANNQKNAILDVDMGGGKTCMMVADICNQLSKGTAKRPLIVCPNKTLVQNKNEIFERWTDKRMNIFIINTETYNNITNRGKDLNRLIEVMNRMPPNTIFMTSYDFLIRDNYEVPLQEKRDKNGDLVGYDYTTIYPIPKLLLQEVGIDMVYCDESQYIKNSNSGRSNAVAALSGAKIKRITSGTIIPNNPVDLFAQLRFVDPSILGTYDSFIKRYAEMGDGRGKIVKWKDGAQKRIREEIERKGGVSIRRSMWRWMMPKLDEKVHFVNLTKSQSQLYEYLMSLAIDEIMKDAKLKKAFETLKEAGEDTGVDESDVEGQATMKVLSILSKVTGYLAAPATHNLVKEFSNFDQKVVDAMDFTEEDFVGPKIYKMRSIIENHFAGKKSWEDVGKIIVFTERVAVAEHAFDYLGDMQEHAVWYRAGRDTELERFKTDDDIWILIAVDKSIKEGQNLQVASRIIRLDIPWTPGDLNQSYARAYRTRQERDVNVDLVLCNGTMEICKYNNLISKEYIARKIISSFDEGDDNDFIPVKMSISNMQSIKWDSMCEPYIEMHKRINEQELEEARVYGEKYKNYKASGVSNVGSTEDLPGSQMVYVPETSEDRILLDENGKVIKTESGRTKKKKVSYDVDDIGLDLDFLKGKYGGEEADDDDGVDISPDDDDDDNNDVEVSDEDKKDTGLHLYFLQYDTADGSELFLMTFFNKSTSFLKRLRFKQDPFTYVKALNTIEDLKMMGKKLKKQGYKTNIGELANSKEVQRLFAKPKKAGALQRVRKHFVATSASKEGEFYIARMEGQLFLISYDKFEGFTKVAKTLYRDIDNKAMAEKVLKMIAKEAEITNLDELAIDFKVRFKTALDVEKLGLVKSKKQKVTKEKVTKSKEPEKKAPDSTKYNGKQIVLGIFNWAKKNSQVVRAYNVWTSKDIKGIDFKQMLADKGCTNVSQSVKYLLEKNNKTTKQIIDWFNSKRGSVVAKFLNTYKKEGFGSFKAVEPFVSKIEK